MKKQILIVGGATALVLMTAATPMLVAAAAANLTDGHGIGHKGGHNGDRGKGHQARWEKMDADGNGTVSKAESIAAAKLRFAEMDADGNGTIDSGDRAARIKQHYLAMDADKNGAVSADEFATAQEKRAEARGDGERLHGRRGEGRGAGRGRGEGRGGRHHGGGVGDWGQADTNGDKAISRAEFDAATLARFAKADVNKDGNLTKDEARAARRAMWEQRKAAKQAG